MRSVWTTNFDRLAARNSADFNHTTIEVGIDCQDRLYAELHPKRELVCVSLHGDYRYDSLKNTPGRVTERKKTRLRETLIEALRNTPLIVDWLQRARSVGYGSA